MAEIEPLDSEGFNEWLKDRPDSVRALAEKLPPNKLYKLKTSGHRVSLYSYSEDGTVAVFVSGKYNAVAFERHVFGINPDDLEECDFPLADEKVGAFLGPDDDIPGYLEFLRKSEPKEEK